MAGLGYSHVARSVENVSPVGRGPRRATTRRWDNVLLRPFRPLVTGTAPDHPAGRPVASSAPTFVKPVQPAMPFLLRNAPRGRIGPVPKLAPGHQGPGLGVPVGAGFQQLQYTGFTPLEDSPSRQPNFRAISIPRVNVVPWMTGRQMAASYHAHDFTPATRFFNQARSAPMWAQSHFPPQQRPLTIPVQINQIRIPSNVARRQIPSGQVNAGLYNIGYPTRVGVAAAIGGGPIAVLGSGF